MQSKKKKTTKKQISQVSLSAIAKEDLPYPVVHYPKHYGSFFAFSKFENSNPVMCKCTKSAVVNYLKLFEIGSNLFLSNDFPRSIVDLLGGKIEFLRHIEFKDKLCHRCNLATPSLRYCHEMYGAKFVQNYGWYIEQNYFRLGILLDGTKYIFLPDSCPENIQAAIKVVNKYQEKYSLLYEKEISKRGTHIFLLTDELKQLDNQLVSQIKYIVKEIENYTRQEFGFRKIGDRWINETLLYQIVSSIFKDEVILRHYRPDWLEGLELDIFIPSLNIAFEYQGQQHFHPIKAWGGLPALKSLQERDKKKLQICTSLGVKLFIIDYTEPLNEEYVLEIINSQF